MMMRLSIYVLVGLLLAALLALWEGLSRWGNRRARQGEEAHPDLIAIQGGLLGLFGLLLGFTYAYVVNRYEERRLAVIAEANALSTTYNLTDYAPQASGDELRSLLREYAASRIIEEEQARDPAKFAAALKRTDDLQARIWRTQMRGVSSPPRVTDATLSSMLNQTFDMHTSRLAAARDRLPEIVIWMLLLAAATAVGMSGFVSGLRGHHNRVVGLLLAVLTCAVIFVILDLDRPRSGLIKVSQQPLIDLAARLK